MRCTIPSKGRGVAHIFVAYVVVALASFALPTAGIAQGAPRYAPSEYVQSSHDLPMRDGITLHLEVFAPKNIIDPLPFLLQRTPYGVAGQAPRLSGGYKELAEDGYIFVFEDIRGRYKSNGTFVMQRPPRPLDGPQNAIDESTDTYDTIKWLLTNMPKNNGRVGMHGTIGNMSRVWG